MRHGVSLIQLLGMQMNADQIIKRAKFPKDLDKVLCIYRDYIGSASVNLDFQDNEKDFRNLSQQYSGKDSVIFLAWYKGKVIGCAAFRRVNSTECEIKRVYVRPAARGGGVGLNLINTVIESAKKNGYRKIYLDVLPEFDVATKLYESIGFEPTEPITYNPVPGTKFLGLDISKDAEQKAQADAQKARST